MDKSWLKNRITQLGLLFFFLFVILGLRLMVLQIHRGPEYRNHYERLVMRVIPLKAPRGAIYDRNGHVLAWNRPSMNLEIYQDALLKGDSNRKILTALEIMERHRDACYDNLPLVYDPERETEALRFEWGTGTEDEQARAKVRWLKLYRFPEDITPFDAYQSLRRHYRLEEAYTTEEALKILSVWNEIRTTGYRTYRPVIIARDLKLATAAVLEEHYPELGGIEVTRGFVRHYPHRTTASHVLGFMGRITAEEWEANRVYYEEQGYDPAVDLVGRWELERVLEPYLKGQNGGQRVQVDAAGRNVRILEHIDPIPGHDVYLTLDLNLQKRAENALADTMSRIRSGAMGEARPNAYVGAVVALDVRSGGVLALASLPGYDPNFSVTGRVDPALWQTLNPFYSDPRNPERENLDPTLPRPLKNNAVRGIFPPGSTYKMLVALAGLEEGVITPRTIIDDQGRYTRFTTVNPPACWIWHQRRGSHGSVDVVSALRDSCNYYFYETGYRLGIEWMEAYARRFGFGQPTGIELPGEAGGIVAGIDHTHGVLRAVVRQRIAEMAGHPYREAPPEQQRAYDDAAVRFIENNSLRFIETQLAELGIQTNRNAVDSLIYSYIRDNQWNAGKTLSAAIGQAENTYTPLQMAAYTAALVNGGIRYRAHLIERILSPEGEAALENMPEVLGTIDMQPEHHQALMLGMRAVVSNEYKGVPGTAYRTFANFPIATGGKTGSAQFPGREAFAWFVGFAPYNQPEIAVAVMIAQGGSGGYAAPVAREIFAEYFGLNQPADPFLRRNRLIR